MLLDSSSLLELLHFTGFLSHEPQKDNTIVASPNQLWGRVDGLGSAART